MALLSNNTKVVELAKAISPGTLITRSEVQQRDGWIYCVAIRGSAPGRRPEGIVIDACSLSSGSLLVVEI